MKAPMTLRRPANWQDFETLCAKLWGEIWKCPEIQKNGRLGQDQSGVDIFGIPYDDNSYYGIQCKGKSEYNDNQYEHPQFTEKEIIKEIEKAKKFTPPLKKFYLATTALNDSKTQAFVREKNLEHRKNNIFEVHLFCWETIVDLIDENKRTHDYFVRSQNFKSNQSVSVTFMDDTSEINLKPKFKKAITNYRQKILLAKPNSFFESMEKQRAIINSLQFEPLFSTKVNLSYIGFSLKIKNTGNDPIEEYKLLLEFDGDVQDLTNTNEKRSELSPSNYYFPNTYLWVESLTGKVVPQKVILVGDDSFVSDDIFIKTMPQDSIIIVKWKLISKDFKDDGVLKINVTPEVETIYSDILVEDPLKVKTFFGEIEEYIVDKKSE